MSEQPPANEPAELARPWPVVIANALLIVAVLLALPLCVAGVWHGDFSTSAPGVLLGVPIAWLGVQIYRGAVRCEPRSASLAALYTLIFASLLACWTLSNLAWEIREYASSGRPRNVLNALREIDESTNLPLEIAGAVILLGATAALSWCGIVNNVWATQLAAHQASREQDPADVGPRQWTLREALLLMAMLAWVLGAARWHVLGFPPATALHVDRAAAPIELPPDAADVSFRRTSDRLSIEFTCSLVTLLDWLHVQGSHHGSSQTNGGISITPPSRPDTTIQVQEGWHFLVGDGHGNELQVTYDSRERRAYYQRSYRTRKRGGC